MRVLAWNLIISIFFFNFELNNGASNSSCDNGPDPAYYGRPSAIANLFCFLSGNTQPGQSYMYIGFDDYIVAFCSYFYDCQPAQRAYLSILDVYGYLLNVTYTMKNGTKGFTLYYLDMTVQNCPQFQTLQDPTINLNSFDIALKHSPKPVGLSYTIYQKLYQDTNLSCNTFPGIKVSGDDCSNPANLYTCPVRSPYMFKTPVASVDFGHIKNVMLTQFASDTLDGQILVDDNGLYATCVPRPNPDETDNSLPLEEEYCTADRYDNFPYCNRLNPQNSFAELLKSYGYNEYIKSNGLNANTACTMSTLYAQGFNKGKCYGKDYSNCNCNSFTTFVSFIFLLNTPQYNPQNLNVSFVGLKGYCENSFREDIMRKFLTTC